jgi:hypothetical protein
VGCVAGDVMRHEGWGADEGSDWRELDTGACAAGGKRGSKDIEKNESVYRDMDMAIRVRGTVTMRGGRICRRRG